MLYLERLYLVSRIVAVVGLVLGIAFFWVGPSTFPVRPVLSMFCLVLSASMGFMAFSLYYAQKIRKTRLIAQ